MYRELVAGLVREIETDTAAERELTGREPLGPEAILSQHPHTRPEKIKKSPAPLFHAASKAARQGLRCAGRGRFVVYPCTFSTFGWHLSPSPLHETPLHGPVAFCSELA